MAKFILASDKNYYLEYNNTLSLKYSWPFVVRTPLVIGEQMKQARLYSSNELRIRDA